MGWEMLGGKFALMADMLAELRRTSTDRVVIVSNYTQTLDLFGQLCRQCNVSWCAQCLSLCAEYQTVHRHQAAAPPVQHALCQGKALYFC